MKKLNNNILKSEDIHETNKEFNSNNKQCNNIQIKDINDNNINKNIDVHQINSNKSISNNIDLNINNSSTNLDIKNYLNNDNHTIKEQNIIYINYKSFTFDGKIFKYYSRLNRYKKKNNIERIVYKCKNYRRNESIKNIENTKRFCNATIIFIPKNQHIKGGYIFKEDHSEECYKSYEFKIKKKLKKKQDRETFTKLCENVMNTSTIYDRNIYKEEFKKIYNNNQFNFTLTKNILTSIITNWKSHTNRFNKTTVLDNIYDYNNNLILREFRSINVYIKNKKQYKLLDYVIWCNNENIARIRLSENIFIDSTFHHPKEYSQLLIIMYKDRITEQKIPAFFILMNGKDEMFYNIVFENVINIITQRGLYKLSIKSIVTDSEQALVNSVEKNFPNIQRISCLFHFKQDIVRN